MPNPNKNRFGNVETIMSTDPETYVLEKLIQLGGDSNHYYFDYEQQTNHLNEMTSFLKGEKEFKQPGDVEQNCHTYRKSSVSPDAQFMFLPAFTGQLKPGHTKVSFEGNCFEEITFEITKTSETEFDVTATTAKKRDLTCSDFFLFGNTEIMHVEDFLTEGTHKMSFKASGPAAIADLQANGLETYLFCESLKDELLSVMNSLKAFIGGLGMHGKIPLFKPQVPEYMEKANLEFLKWAVDIDLEERKTRKVVIDEDLIQSGDYFAVQRLDGLDPMIMYGTGSHSGHSVVALRMDGKLYITESQDAWYFPTHRIQRTLFSEWIQYAEECDFNVVHMPLSAEQRAKWDNDAAVEWF